MPRPIWKGYISFGLVNVPVVVYSGENKVALSFKMVDKRNHGRIRYERINEETGKEVPWNEVAKGYEYDENRFVLMSEEDLKSIAGENSKTISIENFISQDSIESVFFEKPYFLVPDKKGDKGYVILREVLKATKKVGITKVIIHTKEYLAALIPYKDALVLNIIRYSTEVKNPAEFNLPKKDLKAYKITAKEMDIAKQLVASMTEKWKPESYQDDYQIALQQWIEEKINEEKPHTKMKKRAKGDLKRADVINFVDLLRKSLNGKDSKKTKSNGKHPPRKTKKTSHKHARVS